MSQILINTNAYTAFKRGLPKAVEIIQQSEKIYISVIVLGELLSGFSTGTKEEQNKIELSKFLNSLRVEVLDLTHQTAKNYAKVYKILKEKGTPIPTNDMWLIAMGLQHELTIFAYDKHFFYIDEIDVIPQNKKIL